MEFEYWETEEYQNWCNENCSCHLSPPCGYHEGCYDDKFKQEYWHLFEDEQWPIK